MNIGLHRGEELRRKVSDQLGVLDDSVARLRFIAQRLTARQLRMPAYPTEWNIADVLSHIGSGAVITELQIDAAMTNRKLAADLERTIWDYWDAKKARSHSSRRDNS
jgi:hypothetical protein